MAFEKESIVVVTLAVTTRVGHGYMGSSHTSFS